jgi:tetratricopeptide (TPR) repeat protein
MDWGLAKVLGQEAPVTVEALAAVETQAWTQVSPTPEGVAQTQAGTLVGTPAYIAPEQAVGELARVNERSDVFGLGALLAVMLTGEPPYVGDTFESVRVQAVRGKLEDCFARLDASGAEPELVALCKKCLAFEPADRPADAGAVAQAVAGLRAAADERARRAELERVRLEGERATAEAKAVEEAKRRRLTLALAATVVLALTLGGGGWLWVKAERDAQQSARIRDFYEAMNAATTLRAQGQFDRAREEAQRALVLVESGPADAALKDQVTRLKAELDEEENNNRQRAEGHYNQGLNLQKEGKVDEAIVSFEKAIALYPKDAQARRTLAVLYLNNGNRYRSSSKLDEAMACFKKAIELDPKSAPARTELAKAERLAAARDKLPAFQNGSYTPASTDECLALLEWCRIKKLHHTATRLYATAFAADPKLADGARHRYNAACYGALAAAGQGEDAAKLDDKERTRLRQQARDWLRADLALLRKRLESGKLADPDVVQQALWGWERDTNLAGIRDAAAIAKLPAEERADCEKLWGGVVALIIQRGAGSLNPARARQSQSRQSRQSRPVHNSPTGLAVGFQTLFQQRRCLVVAAGAVGRGMLLWLQHLAEQVLGVCDEVHAERPALT